jgi:hypothetical protein
MARVLGVLLAALVAWQAAPTHLRKVTRMADTWPYPGAPHYLRIDKTAGLEMTDTHWMHLHETGGAVPSAESVTWRVMVVTWNQNAYVSGTPGNLPTGAPTNFEVRYTVRGTPISAWMAFPASFTIDYDDPALDFLENGIHDIAVEARSDDDLPVTDDYLEDAGTITGGATFDYDVQRSFLHFHRDGNTTSATVPIFESDHQPNASRHGVVYVNVNDRNMARNYNVRPDVTPWTAWPAQDQDLYQEAMQPHTELFRTMQMWWEEPTGTADAGLKFVRAFPPKLGEFPGNMYTGEIAASAQGVGGHRNFPVKDGPRGIGWSDGYVQGGGQSFDSSGNFYFVNMSGQVRVMEPNGELHTVAGWRVKLDKDPVWWMKSLDEVRVNMELRGNWPGNDDNVTELARTDPGFHQPTDIVKDKDSDVIFYVSGGYDHCIYKVTVDPDTWEATEVAVLAGLRGTSGHADGTGTSALFWYPSSITQHPSTGDLYVADFDNDAIRKVTLAGVVTTVYGHNDLMTRLAVIDSSKVQAGSWAHPGTRTTASPTSFTRANAIHTVDSAAASGGTRPDFHMPQTVRFDSNNDLIVLDRGMDSIRRINLTTHVTTAIHNFTGGGFGFNERGWQWIDVDRWGVIGPLNTILLCLAVSTGRPSEEPTERFNEELHHIRSDAGHEGEGYYVVKGPDTSSVPDGWGKIDNTDIAHYPWLGAVDPRGAIIVGGIGEHGLTRIRRRRADDPYYTIGATAASGVGLAERAFREAKDLWYAGQAFPSAHFQTMTDLTEYRPGTPPTHKFGYGVMNMLGFNTAWQLAGNESDAELISLFELGSDLTTEATVKANMLWFIRLHQGPETEAHYNRARIIVRRAN